MFLKVQSSSPCTEHFGNIFSFKCVAGTLKYPLKTPLLECGSISHPQEPLRNPLCKNLEQKTFKNYRREQSTIQITIKKPFFISLDKDFLFLSVEPKRTLEEPFSIYAIQYTLVI